MSVRSCAVLVSASALVVTGQVLVSAPAAATAAPATSAAAGDVWGPIHAFEQSPVGQSVAVDGHNVTTAVWGSQKGWPEPVKVARRTAAGRWSAPVRLGIGYDPVVGVDAAGNLTVAWSRDRQGFTTGVWASRKPVGQPWTRPVRLSADVAVAGYPDGETRYGATDLDVAVHPGGATLVTWQWGSAERHVPFRIQAAYRPVRGPWGPVHALTPAAGAHSPHAAFAPDGTGWVAWERTPASGPTAVKVRSRSTDGVWRPTVRIGSGALGDVAAGRHGVTVVLGSRGRVRVADRPASTGVWSTPVPVTPAGVRVQQWSVSLNPAGAALVAYVVKHERVDVVRRTLAGHWTGAVTVASPSPTLRLMEVATAVNPRGDMFVGWDNSYGIWGRYRSAGGAWRATTTAQADVGQVDVLETVLTQMTPDGRVVLLWDQEARPLRARVLNPA